MSQQGSEDHIFKRLGRDLEMRRGLEHDAEAMAILRKLRAKGYSGDVVQAAMNRLILSTPESSQ